MKKSMNKKGAMELSMNTIVVVVIGITLLVLGLVFVRGIFEKLGGLGSSAFRQAEQELGQIQTGDTKINFPSSIEIKKGKAIVENLKICNTDGALVASKTDVKMKQAAFFNGLEVTIGTIIGAKFNSAQIEIVTDANIGPQECLTVPVLITATPTTVVTTSTPFLTIEVLNDGAAYASIGVVFSVIS